MNIAVFGTKLKEIRESKNLSQKDLAKLLHVSSQTISNWEISASFPSLPTFEKLVNVLETTPNYLTGCEELPEINTNGLDKKIVYDIQILVSDFKKLKTKN